MQPTLSQHNRVASIDILRGIIMLVMALDHTRDFFHITAMTDDPLNLNTTSTGLFLTRWVTHFCAPVFVFLSGLSAYLSGRNKTKKELSAFLIKRGFWLILIELLVISFALSWDPRYGFFLFQVIWAIGWSMIILGLLIRASYRLVLLAGIILVAGHNVFDFFPDLGQHPVMQALFTTRGTIWPLPGQRIVLVAYAILPYTGIMCLGYAMGKWYDGSIPEQLRKKRLLWLGAGAVALLLVLRFADVYGNPDPLDTSRTGINAVLAFIDVSKYPPSLMFTLMTVGVALILLRLFEGKSNIITKILAVYGKVPFFYYILHFFLIHFICMILFFAEGYPKEKIYNDDSFFAFRPVEFGYQLLVVYAIWLLVIVLLYLPCKWFVKIKEKYKHKWWISYL